MRVRLSHEAEADLEVIADFIAESDPARAFDTVVDLRAACSALGENPRRFPLVPRYVHLGVRRRVSGQYLVFYVVNDRSVDVLRIVHGATDYEKTLFPGW